MVLAVAVTACDSKLPVPTRGQRVRPECPPTGDPAYFFPDGVLVPENEDRDYERRVSLSSYMGMARIKSLSCGTGKDAYRLIWGGGYGEPLIVITIDEATSTYAEFVPFNIEPRKIKQIKSMATARKQFQELTTQLELAHFWSVDAVRSFESEGSGLILEGRRGDSYRSVSRSHPEKALFNLARLFTEIVGVAFPSGLASRVSDAER